MSEEPTTNGALPDLARPSLSDEIVELLKRKIITNQFTPGQKLDMNELQRQMGISRTPLTNAMMKLEELGLVEVVPRRGTFVVSLTSDAIEVAYEIRIALEEIAIAHVMPFVDDRFLSSLEDILSLMYKQANLDPQDFIPVTDLDYRFHGTLVARAGNKLLERCWEQANCHAIQVRIIFGGAIREIENTHAEHVAIVSALRGGDVAAALSALRSHLERSKRQLLKDVAGQEKTAKSQTDGDSSQEIPE